METQPSLFNLEPPVREERDLLVVTRRDRPLTKAQRTFNRLAHEIEGLRRRLDEEVRRFDTALAFYGEQLHPRLQKQNALRKDIVRALIRFLAGDSFKTKRERKALRTILSEQLDEIIGYEGSLADGDLRDLFERLHGVDFAKAEQEELNIMRSVMEDMFDDLGLDVDLSDVGPGMSEEEFAKMTAEMAEQFQQQAAETQSAFQRPGRRKTKRQMEKELLQQQAEEVRKKSIATIYKQLARVLHPDLEQDAALRDRKVGLMQELTAAYRNHDLHTLLRMELAWIQREQGDLSRLADEKLAIYNQVLKEQVAALQQEIAELPFHPRYQPIAILDGPFEIHLHTSGPAEAAALDTVIVSFESSLTRLQTEDALDEVRGLVREFLAARQPRSSPGFRGPRETPF